MRCLIPALLLFIGCGTTTPSSPRAGPPAATRPAPTPVAAHTDAERVTVRFVRTPLPEALETLGAKVGWNLVPQPGVTTRVDLVLRDVPWRLALAYVLERTHCEAQRRGERTLYIHEPPRVTLNH